MFKIFNAVCLTVLCMHNQLFAGEAIRALSTFNDQLQELTTICARAETAQEPRVMSAQETLAYMQQSGGEIKLTAAQEQELQAAAAKERKEQTQKNDEEQAKALTEFLQQSSFQRSSTDSAEVCEDPQTRKKMQFLKEVASLFEKTFALLKASKDIKDTRRWNRYLTDAIRTYKEHTALQDQLRTIEKSFSDVSEQQRQTLIEEALLRVMSYEKKFPEGSNTEKAVHQFLSRKAAQSLGKKLKLSEKEIARSEMIIEATKLPPELAGIVAGYDMPVFQGKKKKTVLAVKMQDVVNFWDDHEIYFVTQLLALSPQQIVLTMNGKGMDTRVVFVMLSGQKPQYHMISFDFPITSLGKMPGGQVLVAGKDGIVRLIDPQSQKEQDQLEFSTLAQGAPTVMATTQDGVMCGSHYGLSLIRITEGRMVRTSVLPGSEVWTLAALADGRIAYSSDVLAILDLTTNTSHTLLQNEASGIVRQIVQLPHGNIVAVLEKGRQSMIDLWDSNSERHLKNIKVDGFITSLVALPDGRIVHNGGRGKHDEKISVNHALTLLDLATGESQVLDDTRNVSKMAVVEHEGQVYLFVAETLSMRETLPRISIWI